MSIPHCSSSHSRRGLDDVVLGERSEVVPPSSRASTVASNLRIDAATAEVARTLETAGIRFLLIKGPSTARWLYPEGTREYADSDLLVEPARWEQAGDVLASLGFANRMDDGGMPEWWREHSNDWWRALDGVSVDLHRSLPGVLTDPEAAWQVLAESSEALTVARARVTILGIHARTMLIALHAAHHGARWNPALEDLERALSLLDDTVWSAAAELADRLDANDAFRAGLRLTPRGTALASRLHLPDGISVETALRASTPPPVALGIERVAQAPTARARTSMILLKLFPPAEFMRHWDPAAGDSRLRLLRAYVRRPFWIIRRAPGGWRAWRDARGISRSSVRTGEAR